MERMRRDASALINTVKWLRCAAYLPSTTASVSSGSASRSGVSTLERIPPDAALGPSQLRLAAGLDSCSAPKAAEAPPAGGDRRLASSAAGDAREAPGGKQKIIVVFAWRLPLCACSGRQFIRQVLIKRCVQCSMQRSIGNIGNCKTPTSDTWRCLAGRRRLAVAAAAARASGRLARRSLAGRSLGRRRTGLDLVEHMPWTKGRRLQPRTKTGTRQSTNTFAMTAAAAVALNGRHMLATRGRAHGICQTSKSTRALARAANAR